MLIRGINLNEKPATKILIDNGHSRETPGKRNHDAALLVSKQEDITLAERCRRVNELTLPETRLGHHHPISIHANAAGRGDRWYDTTGWCAYTTRGDTRADGIIRYLAA